MVAVPLKYIILFYIVRAGQGLGRVAIVTAAEGVAQAWVVVMVQLHGAWCIIFDI